MTNATGPLQSNDYKIVNVGTGGAFATIESAGGGVSVQGSTNPDLTSVQWHVENKNGNYTITSKQYGQCAAYTTATPAAGDPVKTSSGVTYQWIIKETSTPGQYIIYSSNNDTLYWGLTSSTATVRMTATSDGNAKWNFTYL